MNNEVGCRSILSGPSSRLAELAGRTGYWYSVSLWYERCILSGTISEGEGEKMSYSHLDLGADAGEGNEKWKEPLGASIAGSVNFEVRELEASDTGYYKNLFPSELLNYVDNYDGELFGTGSEIRLLGASDGDDMACGCAALRIRRGGQCELLWLYVAEEARHQGCAVALMRRISYELSEAMATGVYFLAGSRKQEEETGSVVRLFGRLGCMDRIVTEHIVTVTFDRFLQNFGQVTGVDSCYYLTELPSGIMEDFLGEYSEADRKRAINFQRRIEHEKGGATLPIEEAFEPESCICIEKGRPAGMLLFTRREDGRGIVLVSMKAKNQVYMAKMLTFAVSRARNRYGEYGRLTFAALNGVGETMGNFFGVEEEWIRVKCKNIPLG